jgi:hypothetical protein
MVKRVPVPLGGRGASVPVAVVFNGKGKGAVLVDTVESALLSDVIEKVGIMTVIVTSVNVLV